MSYLSSPETRSRAARLDRVLNDLLARTPEVEAAAVMSFDGLPMASAMPPAMDEDRVAAMSAALLSLGERATQGLGRGALDQIYIEGENGTVFLVSARDEAVLMAVSSAGSKVGMMRYEVRQAADVVGEVLASASAIQDLGFEATYEPAFGQPFDEVPQPSFDEPESSFEVYEPQFGEYEPPAYEPEFGAYQPSVEAYERPVEQYEPSFEPPIVEPYEHQYEQPVEPFDASSEQPESQGDHAAEAYVHEERVPAPSGYDVASVPTASATTFEVQAVDPVDQSQRVDERSDVSQPVGALVRGGIPFWA